MSGTIRCTVANRIKPFVSAHSQLTAFSANQWRSGDGKIVNCQVIQLVCMYAVHAAEVCAVVDRL